MRSPIQPRRAKPIDDQRGVGCLQTPASANWSSQSSLWKTLLRWCGSGISGRASAGLAAAEVGFARWMTKRLQFLVKYRIV